MTEMWSTAGKRGVAAGHVDDRGHGNGAAAGCTPEQRRRAVRAVAAGALDAVDCVRLLDQLGLDPSEAKEGSNE